MKAALEFLSLTDVDTEDLMCDAKLAWKRARRVQEDTVWDEFFYCRKGLTLCGFVTFYENIVQELEAAAAKE